MNEERQAKLNQALERILLTLAAEYWPEKVILFGSMAHAAVGEWSDLDLVIIKERSRLITIAHVPRLFNGSVGRMPECSIHQVREVTLECPDPMLFHVDGEPVEGGTRLVARVHPGALKVCVA